MILYIQTYNYNNHHKVIDFHHHIILIQQLYHHHILVNKDYHLNNINKNQIYIKQDNHKLQ